MDRLKEKLLELLSETDEILKMNIVEELTKIYMDVEKDREELKRKYSEIHEAYIDSFMRGTDVEVEIEIEPEIEVKEDIKIDDLFE